MPGPIITASNAKKAYKNKGVKPEGSNVSLKNSSGKRVKVAGNAKVYHRGKGNFGLYTETADKKRISSGSTPKDKVGSGRYRQANDRRRR
ncbi:hypothetical protein [uncultured Methanomethylovorans sp.]|uniref:hypothetical protein n=1 Tax=uncultured Methanomethylovorans sp. TaxID=183759 RepID=UPI002AA75ADB|nr:hypothetical protein [uncultured Methanomethylovorans sp.]